MPYDEPADLIASAEATIDTIALLLGDISEEVGDTPGAWSIAHILNHLLDTERRYFARVRRLRTESQPQMKVMPDADVTRLTALQAWKLFYKLRQRHIRLLRSLKPGEWRRSGTLSPIGKVTIAGIIRHMSAHDATHTAQIARRLSGRPG
ncbi:MAG: DinB family protein [Chloroflexi bacterium]|nr:MAG: DinB family protein [Chloroflexota bacterium]TMF86689.1 MAG: DinB family protein [Chloroflexota bacterium]TMG11551.1 MAG: DinB family protein [Chloroflexota bacterium]